MTDTSWVVCDGDIHGNWKYSLGGHCQFPVNFEVSVDYQVTSDVDGSEGRMFPERFLLPPLSRWEVTPVPLSQPVPPSL